MNVQTPKRLAVIDGETLMDARLPKRNFCVETLLPEGISMLGGAPKVGNPGWFCSLLCKLQKASLSGIFLPNKVRCFTLRWKILCQGCKTDSTDSQTKPLPLSTLQRRLAQSATNCACRFPNSFWNIPIPCSSSLTPSKSSATTESKLPTRTTMKKYVH